MSETIEFNALGPLEARRDGERIELGPHKQRSLLALLLINANRVVSKDRIAEALWGPDATDTENALWVYVSRLRTVLEPERSGRGKSTVLITREPGYVLTVDPTCVDFLRFEQALTSARDLMETATARAVEVLDEAIASWRGDPLADFAYETWARAEIDRLDELRLEALELGFDARLRLGHAAELINGLETLARENPYRERPVAQLMTALYRSGRQAEALRAFERHRRILSEELGIDPSPELRRLEEQILLHDEKLLPHAHTHGPAATDSRNPYKGLHAFQEDDAADFYGRETLVAELLRRLERGDRLLALVGPSGSGKSSVVRAGLIPRVRKEDAAGSSPWLIAQMVPGAHPFTELEAALLRTRLDAPDSLSEQLADGDVAILRAALRVLPDDTRLLLVIDQFEELFTLVDERDVQRRFLDGLLVAIGDPHGRVTVVITLRADFYDRPLLHPAFGARLGETLVNVMPLTASELEEAASEPATMAGVSIEPALLGRLIGDVVDHPGALPMFQYTLTELYERREGDVLTTSSYDEIGGVRGAITHRAEDLYGELGPEEEEAARQLFLRLVSMADDDTWSRRRVRADEIISLDVDIVALQAVIDRFGSRRLLFFDRDRTTGAPTLEVGHEALLTEWERLGAWIREARRDLLRHASFVSAVDDWERSGQDPGYLVTGARLAEYEQWAGSSRLELNLRELQFLGASLEAREAEVRADQERTEREARLAGRARRRLWAAVAALAVLIGVVGALVAFGGEDKTHVAVVTDGNEDAQNALLLRGVEQAAADLPIEVMEVTPPISDLRREFQRLADAGAELIIVPATVNAIQEIRDMAPELPEVTFVSLVVDAGWFDERDVVTAVFVDEQGGFLAGVAAATETETGVVGFVGGAPVPDVHRRRAGFEAGVASVDPGITVLARYIGADGDLDRAFQRPDLGEAAAADLFARNADVVYHAAGSSGLGVFQAARESTEASGVMRWGIGSDSDQILEVATAQQDHVLTSIVRKYDVVGNDLVRALVDGELERRDLRYSLADGAMGYSTRGDHLSDDAIARITQAEADIVAGTVTFSEIPNGVVLEPLEAPEPVATLEATYHGTNCTHRYEGPEVLEPGDSIRIVLINNGTAYSTTIASTDGYSIFLPANPGTTATAYFVAPRSGRFDVRCGDEFSLLTTLVAG